MKQITEKTKEPNQYITGNTIGYITDDGWEDPNPIELYRDFIPDKKHNKVTMINTGNHFLNILINNYIGTIFFKSSKEVKELLLKDATKRFQQDMIDKYGSLYNYELYRIKRMGLKTSNEYCIWKVNRMGFKSRYEYFEYRAKKSGFKSYTDRTLNNLQKRGFKTKKEYNTFLANRKGFKKYYQLLRHNKKLKKLKETQSD